MEEEVLPGEHPHADRRNWRPAETAEEYLANCLAGLERFSDKRFAQILGKPRIFVHRARAVANIPKDLFERLLDEGPPSETMLAYIGQAIREGVWPGEVEECPCCGHVLRKRHRVSERYRDFVNEWLRTKTRADLVDG